MSLKVLKTSDIDSTDQQNTCLKWSPIWILRLTDIILHCLEGSICSVHLEHAGSLGHRERWNQLLPLGVVGAPAQRGLLVPRVLPSPL